VSAEKRKQASRASLSEPGGGNVSKRGGDPVSEKWFIVVSDCNKRKEDVRPAGQGTSVACRKKYYRHLDLTDEKRGGGRRS